MPPKKQPIKDSEKSATPPGEKVKRTIEKYKSLYKKINELRIKVCSIEKSGKKTGDIFPSPAKFATLSGDLQNHYLLLIDSSITYTEKEILEFEIEYKKHVAILNKYRIPNKSTKFENGKYEEKQEIVTEMRSFAIELEKAAVKTEEIFEKHLDQSGRKHKIGVSIDDKQSRMAVSTTSEIHEKVQKYGMENGCWECGKKINAENNWIADHIPPLQIKDKTLQLLATKLKVPLPRRYTLYPSCKSCSNEQSALVKSINKNPDSILRIAKNSKKYGMLFGGEHRKNGVTVGGDSTTPARDKWKTIKSLCCHICGNTGSHSEDSTYIADHYPPREFNTHYAQTLFDQIGLKLPDPQVRPQCPRCSSKQGGQLSKDANKLKEYADLFGITRYK